jgi:very-short-patch-repair endonuclease
MAWAPREGERRQKDSPRTNARARRMRSEQTPAERRLWVYLRHLNREGASFRRQAAIGSYVFDFADFGARLVIEVDGGVHAASDVALRDAAKKNWAESQGFRVLRFTNDDVTTGLPDVLLTRIRRALQNAPLPNPSPQGGGA